MLTRAAPHHSVNELVGPRSALVRNLTEAYWAGARRGELLIQRCEACSERWHPPLPRCPACHSASVAWIPVSGRGRVYTYTVVYHATHVAMKDRVPYISALIQLDEGPRVLTNLIHCSEEDVRVDMPVHVVFEPLTDEISLPHENLPRVIVCRLGRGSRRLCQLLDFFGGQPQQTAQDFGVVLARFRRPAHGHVGV